MKEAEAVGDGSELVVGRVKGKRDPKRLEGREVGPGAEETVEGDRNQRNGHADYDRWGCDYDSQVADPMVTAWE